MFGAFNIQHLVVVSFLFLNLFEALFKARLFFFWTKKGGLNGYASIIHNIQTLFFLLAFVVPRPELGDGRGGVVIYTRSFWSLFFFLHISLCGLWKERDFGRRAKAGSSGLKLVKT